MTTPRPRLGDGGTLPRQSRLGLIAILLGVAGACWMLTLALMGGPGAMRGDGGMAGMDMAGMGIAPGNIGWFGLTWTVMMAAMMLPSLAPALIAYAGARKVHRPTTRASVPGSTGVFVVGYLASWSAVGVLGYLAVAGIRSLGLESFVGNEAGRYVAGGVIAGAALYQLSGLKDSCLRQCRTPRLRWRPGALGSLRLGVEHGGFCIGSSWALMLVLLVLGMMSIGWMVFITALVALEKLLPWKALAARGIAVSLAVLGVIVAFTPA